ncbi:MAG: bifunctional heptose 7-phosphate kinase/heptose 1-phosphate adenyltransferase [bacterium]
MGLINYINKFKNQTIIVLGDVIADEFISGKPERLSREAPVLILRHNTRNITPGGAANAANNICSLGGEVKLTGVIGEDEPGQVLKNVLEEKGIDTTGIIKDNNRPTSLKTRILAGGDQIVKQQIVRIDKLDKKDITVNIKNNIIKYLNSLLPEIDGILISDYGNGLLTSSLKKEVIHIGRQNNILVAVDSRYNLTDYFHATIATPNLEEAGNALGYKIKKQEEVIKAGKELVKKLQLKYLLITQGPNGMTLFTKQGNYEHIPVANLSEVFDVTGAGDTVVGTFVLALGVGADPVEAMKLSNYAAGIVVRKSGVAAVTPEELEVEVKNNE